MLIWPSAAENNQKIIFFITVFFLGEHVHTEWDKKLIFYTHSVYLNSWKIFIMHYYAKVNYGSENYMYE